MKSNLFFSPAKVLVNTVNTDGVMGKGIAKEFKKLFPEMFVQYQQFCEQKKLLVGCLSIYKTPNKWVLNFPTKKSWRKPSKIEYIEDGLKKFVEQYADKGIQSIAFPPLGCGNGELSWEKEVRPLMEKYLKDLPIDIYIHLYTPNEQEDIPEHKHIANVSQWLHGEPLFLSLREVLTNLQSKILLDRPSSLNGIDVHITEEFDLVVDSGTKKETLSYDDLVDFWSILRKHGIVTRDNIPANMVDSFELIVQIFTILPYVSTTNASTSYKKLNDQVSIQAIQFLPDIKMSYDKNFAI
jgi:O-acetyl-ADP-ribose deacetylase (regulator of RNase III)